MDRNKQSDKLLFLEPVFKQMIWGGSRLREQFSYRIPGEDTGECWAVSAHPNGDCAVKDGEYAGITLSRLWEEHPELFGNTGGGRFPLLVKIIDAKDDLSIQVHPDDSYAGAHENGSLGKTECWYLLDCPEGASLVAGHNAASREELEDMIRGGRWDSLIREIPVKKGDFIQIDPGTVHAIKGGIMILETQQNSDITYRVYDYDRLSDGKPRQLHVEKSIEVITVPAKEAQDSILSTRGLPENSRNLLVECPYYKVWKIDLNGALCFEQDALFLIVSVLQGTGAVNGRPVHKGEHFIIPYDFGEVRLEGNMELITSAPARQEAGYDIAGL